MLDALLATIGILGILATFALKRSKACADAMLHAAAEDNPSPPDAAMPGQRACPRRRQGRRPFMGTVG